MFIPKTANRSTFDLEKTFRIYCIFAEDSLCPNFFPNLLHHSNYFFICNYFNIWDPLCTISVLIFLQFPLPAIIKRPIKKIIHAIGCRVLLFILGFYWINSRYQKISSKSFVPLIIPGLNVASGDLIICNKISYIEILYLGYR